MSRSSHIKSTYFSSQLGSSFFTRTVWVLAKLVWTTFSGVFDTVSSTMFWTHKTFGSGLVALGGSIATNKNFIKRLQLLHLWFCHTNSEIKMNTWVIAYMWTRVHWRLHSSELLKGSDWVLDYEVPTPDELKSQLSGRFSVYTFPEYCRQWTFNFQEISGVFFNIII